MPLYSGCKRGLLSEHPLFGIMWGLSDGMRVMGTLSKATQAEIRVAEAGGLAAQYNFICDIRLPIDVNDVLRRESDNTFFRVRSIPERSPEPAESKFQLLQVELTSRDAVARGG